MAHTKAQKAAKGNKDSISKRLGVKKYGGEEVIPGNIIIRQKGYKFKPGEGVRVGNDFTIYSVKTGKVFFSTKLSRTYVNVK